jgi:hypothetical protein
LQKAVAAVVAIAVVVEVILHLAAIPQAPLAVPADLRQIPFRSLLLLPSIIQAAAMYHRAAVLPLHHLQAKVAAGSLNHLQFLYLFQLSGLLFHQHL